MSDPNAELTDGLWRRLRDVILAAERIDTFAFREAVEPERMTVSEADADALATDFVVRALRVAGEAFNWRILAACAARDDGAALDELAEALGVPRLAVSEHVVELLQAGLVVRALDADRAVATAAGSALVTLVAGVSADLAGRVRRARGGAENNGLPLR